MRTDLTLDTAVLPTGHAVVTDLADRGATPLMCMETDRRSPTRVASSPHGRAREGFMDTAGRRASDGPPEPAPSVPLPSKAVPRGRHGASRGQPRPRGTRQRSPP